MAGTEPVGAPRWPMALIVVIGIVMIVAPFALSMPSKTSAGQKMLDSFHPLMKPAAVAETVNYYDHTFVGLGPLAKGAVPAASEIPALVDTLASALHTTPAGVETLLHSHFPAMADLLLSFPSLVPLFERVDPGLAYYRPLVDTMQANVTTYAKVDSLPNFNLFTWFFVVPGALMVLLGGYSLFASTRRSRN